MPKWLGGQVDRIFLFRVFLNVLFQDLFSTKFGLLPLPDSRAYLRLNGLVHSENSLNLLPDISVLQLFSRCLWFLVSIY